MSRVQKPGEFFNCKLAKDIYDQLNQYADKTRLSKTVIVEMALEEYFKKNMPKDDASGSDSDN